MYIKSNFRDYYDAMQKIGQGDGIVYERYPASESFDTGIPSGYSIIGVCWQRFLMYRTDDRHIYDMDQVKKLIEKKKYKKFENLGIARKDHDKALKAYKEFYNFNLAPIWIAGGGSVHYNPRLWGYKFHEVMDAPTIYQELCMWFNNYAEPRKVIPQMTDQCILELRGFDKYSFRRQPGDKKRKKAR